MSNWATGIWMILAAACIVGCVESGKTTTERTATNERVQDNERDLFKLEVDVRELKQRVKTLEEQMKAK